MIPESIQNSIKQTPYQFDFVQLVRLLYLHQDDDIELNQKLVGYENSPVDEVARFKVSPRMRHGSSDIRSVKSLDDGRYEIEVSFLGLFGAAGVLPHHYSRMILARLKANDETMRNFFDLFHHRILSNFFRASVKYRLPFQHELFSRFQPSKNGSRPSRRIEHDTISRSISCVVGVGERPVQNRLDIDDRQLMYYGGHFANRRPTMIGLRQMLREITGLDVKILQFQFEWLYLDQADQTDLSNPTKRLGQDVVIGNRVGSVQNRFRARLGPLNWKTFQELLPNKIQLKKIAQFTRSYVGIGLDFDFQFLLNGADVPCMQLGNEECGRLGWNTWIKSENTDKIIEDAIFEVDDEFNSS